MAAVTMHHFSGLGAPFVRSKGTVSGGVFIKKEIRTLEDGLKKLEASETKYAVELDNALKEYAELQEQASDFDPVELHKVRQAIRTEHERDAAKRLQDAYGTKYDRTRMYDSKRSVANLLGEEAEERSVTEKLRTLQQNQKQKR